METFSIYPGGRGHGINFDFSYEIENSSSNYRKSVFTACFTRLIIHTAENTFQPRSLFASEDPMRVSNCVSTFLLRIRTATKPFDTEENKIEDIFFIQYKRFILKNKIVLVR